MKLNSIQNARGWASLLLCLLAVGGWTASAQSVSAQPAKDESADVAALRAEVQQLASDLLQCRAELAQWKINSIRAELQQVQTERQHLAGERQMIEREIGALNQASTNGPGAEDGDRREELNTVQLPALLARERAATMRETALAAALGSESARMAEIQKHLQRLPSRASTEK